MNSLSTDNNDSSKTKSLLSSGSSLGRIDTHSHFIPEFYNEIFNKMLAGKSDAPNPDWSVDAALEAMNGLKIRVGILSLGTPGCSIFKKEERRSYARKINECGSEVVKANPDRFGFFATIPCLTDIEGTIEEIKYAFDVLNADGVTLFTAYDGQYLGHEDFKPVWEELDRRKAVVFIHPTMTEGLKLINKFMPPPVVDFPFHITRTATDLVLSNRVRENPNVKIILSQAGGFFLMQLKDLLLLVLWLDVKKVMRKYTKTLKHFIMTPHSQVALLL